MNQGDNRPEWVAKAAAAFARGLAAYREAAEIIIAARAAAEAAGGKLTFAEIAGHFGHQKAWASRLVAWHEAGCPPEGVFAGGGPDRRAKVSAPKLLPGQGWPVFKGVPVDESEATRRVLATQAFCEAFLNKFIGTVKKLSRENLPLAYRWYPGNKNQETLEELAEELERSISAGRAALGEVRAALNARKNEVA